MPYVAQDRRPKLDTVVDSMVEARLLIDGDLNYILFKFCKYWVVPSYNNYKNFCGELRQCVTEIERRLLADYEGQKLKENGDV